MIKATDYIGSLILENDTLQFIQTAEGRVVTKNVDGVDKNEYQYHLKDHLGNVRTTFAVRDDDYSTDYETGINPYFDNYDQITILSNPLKRSGNYAHRLTGGGTNIVGLMKSLYVSKGDKIRAEVYGKYLNVQFTDEGINGAALINALISMLGGGTLTGEGNLVENTLNTDFISAAAADDSEETSPKAYLNYILLDKNFNYVTSGFDRLGESAADPGDGSGTHQRLSFEEILIEEDGYLLVFLSNESDQSVEVFWDDFRVDHHYNAVLQADDYYPFGLTFNLYQRSYSKANNYKYNGKEEQGKTGWYDYGARMYMPDLGRWSALDPAADLMKEWSPYNYTFNNPLSYIDPDGAIPWPLKRKFKNFLRKLRPDDYFGNPRTGQGYPDGYRHSGVDLNFDGGGNTDKGAPVLSTHKGKVVEVRQYTDHNNSAGTYVKIQAPDGSFQTVYMHLDEASVKKGDDIAEGQQIGTLGGSGFKEKNHHVAHLHYEIRKKNSDGEFESINPQQKDGEMIDPQEWVNDPLADAAKGLIDSIKKGDFSKAAEYAQHYEDLQNKKEDEK